MAAAPLPADPTLDEIREAVAPHLAAHAAFDGWTDLAVESAAMEVGVDAIWQSSRSRAGRWR